MSEVTQTREAEFNILENIITTTNMHRCNNAMIEFYSTVEDTEDEIFDTYSLVTRDVASSSTLCYISAESSISLKHALQELKREQTYYRKSIKLLNFYRNLIVNNLRWVIHSLSDEFLPKYLSILKKYIMDGSQEEFQNKFYSLVIELKENSQKKDK